MGFRKNLSNVLKRLIDIDSPGVDILGVDGYRANDLISDRSDSKIMGYYRSWVKVAIDAIAEKVGEIEFKLYDKKGEEIEDHDILKTLNSPNAYSTTYTFFYRIIAYYLLAGEAPIYKFAGKKAKKLIALPPIGFKGIWNREGTELLHYELPLSSGSSKVYSLEEIIPFFSFNPSDPMDGFSTTRSNIYGIETMIEMENWQYQFFSRGGVPPYAVIYDDRLTKEQVDKIKTRLLQEYSGSNNAFQPLVLSGGAKMEKTGLTPKDIELSDQERTIRDKVLGQFKVPKAVIGAVDDVNRANAEASLYTFTVNNIKPKMRLITDMIQKFYVDDWNEGLRLDFVDPTPVDPLAEVQIREKRGKWLTINELRQEEGYAPIEGGENFIGQSMFTLNYVQEMEKKIRFLSEKIERVKIASGVTKEDDDEALIKMLDVQAKNYESRWIKLWRGYARDLEKRLIADLKGERSIKIRKQVENLFNTDKELLTIFDLLETFYREIGAAAVADALAMLGTDNLNNEILLNQVVQDLAPILQKTALTIAKTVKDRISNSLIQGLNAGEGIDELAGRITNVADWMSTVQAQSIAETETTKVTNASFDRTYNQSGAPYKAWVDLGDNRVRDAHRMASGMIVPVDSSFYVGGEMLRYPGDPAGSAENVIRCRCRIVARWELPTGASRGMSLEDHQKICNCQHAKDDASYKFYENVIE